MHVKVREKYWASADKQNDGPGLFFEAADNTGTIKGTCLCPTETDKELLTKDTVVSFTNSLLKAVDKAYAKYSSCEVELNYSKQTTVSNSGTKFKSQKL